jgi:hypothetical protein
MTLLLLKAYDGEFSQERGIALPTRAKHAPMMAETSLSET